MNDKKNPSPRARRHLQMVTLLDRARAHSLEDTSSTDPEDALDRVLMGWFVRWRQDASSLAKVSPDADGNLLLEVLVTRHEAFVYEQAWQIVRKLGLIQEEAFDLTSEVFLALIEKPENYSHTSGRFRGFLRTLTRNKAIDLFRKKKRRKTFSDHEETLASDESGGDLSRTERHADEQTESVEAVLARHDLYEVFLTAYNAQLELLKAQTPRQHEAWVLCVGEGLNSTEAAASLGSSPATVRRNKNLAAKSLRAWLDDFCAEHDLTPAEVLGVFGD